MKYREEQFRNEPQEDFSNPKVHARIEEAVRYIDSKRLDMLKPCPILIGGKEYYTKEYIEVYDPADCYKIFGKVCKTTPELLARACTVAEQAFRKSQELFWDDFDGWLHRRKHVVRNAVSFIREERYHIATIIAHEVSKSIKGALGEVEEAIDFGELYLRHIDDVFVRVYSRPDLVSEKNIRIPLPKGPIAAISVWNFPFSLSVEKIFAAYLTGCPVLFKPAEQSPIIGYYLARLLLRAGMEADFIAYLPGHGDTGEALVRHRFVSGVCFTGSMSVGHKINTAAALSVADDPYGYPYGIKRFEPELGANNPMIVTRSANLDDVIKAVLRSKWEQQGEKCSALQRLIIVAEPKHEFSVSATSRIIDAASSLEYGHPANRKKKYNYNAVIDRNAFDRIKKRIADCAEIKQPLLAVDLSHMEECGYFIGPQIFEGIPHDSPLVGEEIFGPVLFIFFAGTLKEAILLANAYPHITAGIYSQSEEEKKQFVRGMVTGGKSGLIYVNREIIGAVAGQHQFGPMNQSGSGYKLGTKDRLHFFINEAGICENYMSQGVLFTA
ncbi:MAG: hypothetical protein COU47_00945 [Candidatus Niyogibacteria bacterium CG10_big_fil_rev_8_21_14_0_10_46_36]|uniref:Aldehyde dehydrogenase domain-containing protein n=1 Tax=Candidatus Niyogibacteria bacterium CG10_big_fil_rev_8_21_14_0_10_46_36 TaxID=1974726 RepID=A0A2H0TGP7_9BACT|nr:MAG: hypothetical protein COU47_00945 [Candidatus Niyogibacteria bacterium CG10_big_fil_rev_8_21_14_0_10_46_36]